jgi:hypothetical protein
VTLFEYAAPSASANAPASSGVEAERRAAERAFASRSSAASRVDTDFIPEDS